MPENKTAKEDDMLELVYRASVEIAPAITTALATTVVSFLPVFAMQSAEGKLFKPLAFTKTFALGASFLLGMSTSTLLLLYSSTLLLLYSSTLLLFYSPIAFTPGSTLPSINSSMAPPPVETKLTLLPRPSWLTAATESPPPMSENAP